MQVPCLDMLNHSALTERIGVDVQVIGSDRINIVAIRDLDAAEEVARRSAQRNAARRCAEAPNAACRADSLSRRERLQLGRIASWAAGECAKGRPSRV
jgi:hypothetical protein